MARRDDLAGEFDENDDGEAGRGGNGRKLDKRDNVAETSSHGQLKAFIERIERLEEEKQTIADDMKDVYGEAKAMGFDTKAIRKIIKIRKQDANERMEEETILNTYLMALGMRPLGDDEE